MKMTAIEQDWLQLKKAYCESTDAVLGERRRIKSSPAEMFKNLIAEIFEMICLNKTGLAMNLTIQICHGLTEKLNFCRLLTHMLHFELDVLN